MVGRKSAAAASILASVVVFTVACTPGSTPSTTSSTVTTPGTTVPVSGIDCGTIAYASGWPTTTLFVVDRFNCITAAFAAGTDAHLVERRQTDGYGGHIAVTTYQITGVQQVRVTVDNTAALPPGGVTTSNCTGLTALSASLLVGDCLPV